SPTSTRPSSSSLPWEGSSPANDTTTTRAPLSSWPIPRATSSAWCSTTDHQLQLPQLDDVSAETRCFETLLLPLPVDRRQALGRHVTIVSEPPGRVFDRQPGWPRFMADLRARTVVIEDHLRRRHARA